VSAKPSHALRKHLRILDPLTVPSNWEIKQGVPPTRGDCPDTSSAPCPYLACRHHNWTLEQRDRAGNPARGAQGEGTFRPATMESCSLDVADAGGASYEEVGKILGVDHTRVRQIEEKALAKLTLAGVNVAKLRRVG
jgi:hypothetical protein